MNSTSLEHLYGCIQKQYPGQELVFGDGNPDAGLMLVGEAPGRDEVVQKKPFVGRAGKNLDGFLETLGLSRADLYVTNVCKFRPAKVSAKNTVSNRPPTKKEILAAKPFLWREIELVAPRLLVTLGNTPLHAVKDFQSNIGEYHGKPGQIAIGEKKCCLFALYHPASILYNPALKEIYEQDLSNLAVWMNKNF
ncbi:uracil-DNA glycosylase [Christensenella tenuis]|uniref:Type-4 uracil-DNA glycosylase n=1 Tax=Christensenella tenuis TaxID=2763033 RepID=A0ABR7EF31_9FIRM|nr:uracil-DNA glycosylase [Christensenella tenuis]MBC5647773.1 uracil-DNA glycosylase [Christensenella tenuis]